MIISFYFFAMVVLGALVYWLLPQQKARTIFLIMASLGFIGMVDRVSVLLVVILSVYTYGMAHLIEKQRNKKLFHRLGICGLVMVLGIFKYLGFLAATIASLGGFISSLPVFKIEKLLVPLGISYIIFKYISYLTDVYWRIIDKGSFIDFFLYGSLFTIFMAGPIERFERFRPQIEIKKKFHGVFLADAFQRIVFGLFKKTVIADWLGYFIAPLWENQNNFSLGIRAVALLGFSLQIYMDFSAYSDIAIGASKLFGLQIMENFNWPYFQPNISKFWRNWHISLSDWLRDYLFFPLSRMSRNWLWTTVAAPLITMGLCGLWHGAAWHFVIWGLWHGAGIVLLQIWNGRKRAERKSAMRTRYRSETVLATIATFVFVTVGWLWFK